MNTSKSVSSMNDSVANSRLESRNGSQITFDWDDYRPSSKTTSGKDFTAMNKSAILAGKNYKEKRLQEYVNEKYDMNLKVERKRDKELRTRGKKEAAHRGLAKTVTADIAYDMFYGKKNPKESKGYLNFQQLCIQMEKKGVDPNDLELRVLFELCSKSPKNRIAHNDFLKLCIDVAPGKGETKLDSREQRRPSTAHSGTGHRPQSSQGRHNHTKAYQALIEPAHLSLVQEWLVHANPQDKEVFHKVFGSLYGYCSKSIPVENFESTTSQQKVEQQKGVLAVLGGNSFHEVWHP
eukprot:GFYU01003743.1.p1 GENE.GFYU01003743.1~~GFYU01003743.1.p1  ORF type:complete len:293 (-),score=79.16 GFYU01003743.1:227-1105(-)